MVRSASRPRRKHRKVRQKVSRKQKINFSDSRIKAKWDRTKTRRQNLEALGIAEDLNGEDEVRKTAEGKLKGLAAIGEARTEEIRKALESRNEEKKDWVSPEVTRYLERLRSKFGDNVRAMARDIKINYLQHPEGYLRRMFDRLDRYRSRLEAEKEGSGE